MFYGLLPLWNKTPPYGKQIKRQFLHLTKHFMNAFRIVISTATTSFSGPESFWDAISTSKKNCQKNCQKKNCERKLHEITHAHGPRGRFRRFGKVRFSMPALSRQMRLGSKDFASNPGENDSNCPTSTDLYMSIFQDKPKNCFV